MPSGTRRTERGFTFIEFLIGLAVALLIVGGFWFGLRHSGAVESSPPMIPGAVVPLPIHQEQFLGGGSFSVWANGTAHVRCRGPEQCVAALEGFVSAYKHCHIVGVGSSYDDSSKPRDGYYFFILARSEAQIESKAP